jgi:beta-lactamase regulating signal transducer with metallopeptidase domain
VSTHLLLEAAARSLVMGAIILVALRAMRIEQVRARRTAWLLALIGALAMPVLVAAQIGPRLLPEIALAKFTVTPPAAVPPPYAPYSAIRVTSRADLAQATPADQRAPQIEERGGGNLASTALSLAVFGYCAVAAVLSLRLCSGVGFALRLRNQAERVIFPFDPELDVRTSARLGSPVTIGSSVLLPANYSSWDEITLRIVLSHERAHVRQGDFYVQTLAGLHCALFWFNPFSWWLQRQLSELGEALSDRAAVEQAESRTSYAEILLAFATGARWPRSGVAMANVSNLTPRIERLLSDRGFERSFAGKRRLPFVAAGVVQAAPTSSTPASNSAAAAPGTAAADVTAPTSSTNTSTATATNVETKTGTDTRRSKKAAKVKKAVRYVDDDSNGSDANAIVESEGAAGESAEEGLLAIRSGGSHIMIDSGDSLPPQSGDYIYFQHNGKPYLIQDPQVIAKARDLLAPMKMLGEKQKILGHQQAMLGAQQRMLVAQLPSVKFVETPEFKREMAELQERIKELDLPRLTAQIDQRALAEVQAHLGEIQARVGHLEAEFGRQQGLEYGKLGEQQGKLGEEQGKLGAQQALLGEQQRKIVEEVKRQLQPIIEQAIREGKATQIVK